MKFKGYLAHIIYDDQAGIIHGEVINIRDVITFQGKSVDELKKAFEESVEDYLDFCKERNEEPDKPFSGKFTVNISPEQHRKIILAAENSGKDLNSWITDVFAQAAN
ncbi:MAG: type II toxin-antitoxin system HicB family antitoxin [Ignavibacteria bacterium]|nr:type II toxin-antitoxin system HicB family antitoxin [Ignavibacteria bacterium]